MAGHLRWRNDPGNPVLAPDGDLAHECARCMTPCVVRVGTTYRLYYSGGGRDGHQRICMATAPVDAPGRFTRHGVVLDVGEAGAFDAHWCVAPCVHRFGSRWHLYYTTHDGTDLGLQSFTGIGLAVSDDGLHFARQAGGPVITGDQTREYPENRGVAGAGSVVEEPLPNGGVRYRMYYTVAVGRKSPDRKIDQEKHCAVCHSADGIHWTDHRLILSPRVDVAHEDIGVAAPVVWRDGRLYRMLYCGIGTRWGFYSIAEAVSEDGYRWRREDGDSGLSLAPDPASPWASEMVEYPAVIAEDGQLRVYYCGNGYGATGIGTAVVEIVR